MVGIVGKGVGAGVCPGLACCLELFPDGPVGLAVDLDLAGLEIDVQGRRIVDAAQVPHQHIVDKDPHIVVTGKLIGDGGAVRGAFHRAVGLLDKAGGHGDAEIVVDGRVVGGQILHLAELIEGEELSPGRCPAGVHSRRIVDDKGIGAGIVLGKVLGTVVVIIALGVDLQKIPHPGIGRLALVGQVGVEQVGQRFPVLAQDRVSVLQGVFHNAGAGVGTAGVVVDSVGLVGGVSQKPQKMPRVDALVQIGRIHIVRLKLPGDPVVKQVQGGADGRHRVGQNIVVLFPRGRLRSQNGRKRRIRRGRKGGFRLLPGNAFGPGSGYAPSPAGNQQHGRQHQRSQTSGPSFCMYARVALHLPFAYGARKPRHTGIISGGVPQFLAESVGVFRVLAGKKAGRPAGAQASGRAVGFTKGEGIF